MPSSTCWHSKQSDRGDGGALIFRFTAPDGTVLFQDTSGHWSGVLQDLHSDVAMLAAAGRGNIDGEPIQGSLADFVALQASIVEPSTLIFNHHDNWLPGFSIDTDLTPIREALAAAAPNVTLRELGYVDGTVLFP